MTRVVIGAKLYRNRWRRSMRNGFRAGVIPGAMIVLLLVQPHTHAGKASVKSKPRVTVATGKHVAEKKPVSVQVVSFPHTQWQPVRVIRGGTPAKDESAGVEPTEKAETAEIVRFADPNSGPVRVVRGEMDHPTPTPGASS